MTLVKPHESMCIEANRDSTVNKGVFNCIGVGKKRPFVIRGKIKTFKFPLIDGNSMQKSETKLTQFIVPC